MYLEIITPDQKVFAGEVTGVKVPGENGSFEMLNGHAAIISTLVNGPVRVNVSGGGTEVFNIEGGTVEMLDNKIVVLAESVA